MRHYLFLLTGLALAISQTGCENCGPSAEPLLYLSVNTGKQARPDTIYSPDARNPLPAQPYLTNGSQFVLPINLNTDSTQYVYRVAGQLDTVTVYYRRDFLFRNRKCGYVVNLYEPKTGPQANTTAGRVTSVFYQQNTDFNVLAPSRMTGINVTIVL